MKNSKNHYQNIFLIDDDRLFIVKYHKIFTNLIQYVNIEFSMSAATALVKLEDMQAKGRFPELITLDWNLRMGGGELFLEKFEQQFAQLYPNTQVLVISGMAHEIASKRLADYPFVIDVLPKPISMKELAQIV
ncbi:MAG TPA: hypothetical protein DCS93_30370 [Microscillaceae bacterium]|nr:hypothetical protein [Microscillaceae bacterium]